MMLGRLALLRLVRSRKAIGIAVAACVAVALSGWMERRSGDAHGADHVLDLYATFVVPLGVYGLVAVALRGQGLARSGWSLVRLGAAPERVATATVAVTMVASALVFGAVGAFGAACGHGVGDPPVLRDSLQSFGFGALGGAAYAALFALGAAWVARFWGMALLLVGDWLLGSTDGLGAALTPRAHLRNLLGGVAPADLSPSVSLAALAALALACASLAVRRAARARP